MAVLASDTADTVDPVDSLARTREITVAEPEWRRVAAEIRQRIRDQQDLTARDDGTRWLPSYPQLIKQHGTSYGTLRSALLVLEAEGWIVRRPGVGLQVSEHHPK